MPLFKKIIADDISLLEAHRKSLRRCRQTFLKDLEVSSVMDFMVSEEGFRQDQRDAILALPAREQQVTAFLDHLESKGERMFALFVEALKTRHKHLHAFLDETIQTVDKWDLQRQNSEKASITGVVLRRMFAKRRRESTVQNGEDGENPAEKSELQDDCCNYIQCYSVTTKGRLQKEKWITHADSCRTNLAPTQEKSYMAIISTNLIFRRLDWAVTKLRADVKKPPNDNIPAYIFEKESNCAFPTATKQLDQEFADSVKFMQKEKTEQTAEENESKTTCIPTASIRVRASAVPPPVPPKPATLPVVGLRHSPPLPAPHKVSQVQDVVVPPIRTTSKILLPNGTVRLPVTLNRQSLQIPPGHSVHGALRTQSESLSSDCEPKYRRTEILKSPSSGEMNLDDADDEDVDTISLDYNVSVGSTLEPEEELQSGGNDGHDAFDAVDDVKSDGPSGDHLGFTEDYIRKTTDGQPIAEEEEEEEQQKSDVQIKQFEQTQEPLKSDKATSKQMQTETTQDQESHASSCPESDNDRIYNKNHSEDASVQYDLPPAEDTYDDCSAKPSGESLTTNKTHENQNLLISLRSVDQPVFADDEFSSDNSYYEEIEQFFCGCSSPSCQSFNAYLDPRASLLRSRSVNRSAHHHYAAEELRKQGRKFLCRNSLLLVSHDAPCIERKFSSDSSDVAEGKIEPLGASGELDPDGVSDTLLCFDRDGSAFYVPRRFLKKYGDPEGEIWFYPMKISSREAALFLLSVKQEGCFIVYRPEGSSSNVAYNLSLCFSNNDVVHYHILENMHGDYGIEGHDHTFMTVGELVEYFRRNKSSLATRLRRPLRIANHPITPGYHYDICYELNRSDILLTGNILGQGNFGVVCSGMYRNMSVAIKVLQQVDNVTAADEDDFIEEALALMALRHDNIVRLVGVSCKMRPYFLVTEYMSQGNLKDCLRNGFISSDSIDKLFNVCMQVVSAMQYLENIHYMLHRDLAARNFLVDENLDIKLADFGRARIVSDDCYQAPRTEKICIKWAAPEVLIYSHYSTKSDVWSFGVVLWEVFSAGARPFSIFSGEQTAMYVTGGGRLDRPFSCPSDLYEVMKTCWCEEPDNRPSFGELSQTLKSKSNIYVSKTSAQQFLGRRLSADTAKVSSSFLVPEKNPVQRKSVTSSIFGATSSRKTTFSDSNSGKSDTNNECLIRSKNDAQHILNHEGPLSNYLSDFSIAAAPSEIIDIDREDVSRGDRIRKSLRKLINKKSKTKLNELSSKPVPASQEFISLQ